jgi:hypothetical protein
MILAAIDIAEIPGWTLWVFLVALVAATTLTVRWVLDDRHPHRHG